MLAASVGITADELPYAVLDCIQASRSALVPRVLRAMATEHVLLFGRERITSAGLPLPTHAPVTSVSSSAIVAKEIQLLRQELPLGCERRMFGSDHGYKQLPPNLRSGVLMRKFVSIAGRNAANCARDRRALVRYKNYCDKVSMNSYFPVGGPAFVLFVDDAFKSSKGKKGGRTVAHSLKVAFIHLHHHCGLEVEFDAPIMFNTVKPYRGDADTATSPSLWAVQKWELLAYHAPSPVVRLACQVALIASLLSLRAIHLVGSSALPSSTDAMLIINLLSDKDGSANIWAGCDAIGVSGPLAWWPSFLSAARLAGYLVPNVHSSAEVTMSASSILSQGVTSEGMVILTKIAFLCLDVSLEDQVAFHVTGHSFRHFLPCIAEMLAWIASIRDELGRWSTGAANAKRTKCGPRYTVQANQVLQIFIRRVAVQACAFLLRLSDEGAGSAVPCFDYLASCDEVRASSFFGPKAIEYVPGFGRPS
mmetsp:Transcript_48906/g.97571  ORF Transcript_48906/g.97571 Transcript_48906/m.97571 type:complete len:478 (-) Transcript_48906:49-1482(-)